MLELSRFDYYLIIINIIGFLYFLIYIYFLAGESNNDYSILMLWLFRNCVIYDYFWSNSKVQKKRNNDV